MTVFAIFGALITVAIQIGKVLLELRKKKKSIISPLCNLLPFLVFFPSSFIWCLYSRIALQEYPIITMLLVSSVFTEIVTHIMLMHICDEKLSPFGRITTWLITLLPLHVWYRQHYNVETDFLLGIDEVKLLKTLALSSLVFTGSKLYLVKYNSLLLFLCLISKLFLYRLYFPPLLSIIFNFYLFLSFSYFK